MNIRLKNNNEKSYKSESEIKKPVKRKLLKLGFAIIEVDCNGFPDWTILFGDFFELHVEWKKPDGILSPRQKMVNRKLANRSVVVCSENELLEAIQNRIFFLKEDRTLKLDSLSVILDKYK